MFIPPFVLKHPFGSHILLWNQCGFIQLNFARGYSVLVNAPAVHTLDHLICGQQLPCKLVIYFWAA